MKSRCLLRVLHQLAQVQKLYINYVHIHIFTLVFLHTKIRLLKRWPKYIQSIIIHRILRHHHTRLMLLVHVPQFLRLIVKILPNYISRLFLIRSLQTPLTLDNGKFLFLERGFLLQQTQCVQCPVLNHRWKIIDTMFRDRFLFRVILDGQHLTNDRLLYYLNRLQIRSHLLQPTTRHTLIIIQSW
jgi:hypothetical protein